MNKEELMTILPHRDPMLLVDEAEVIDGVAHGKKKITGEEFFLKGHFPDNPIVPGVILCEILGQSACVLFQDMAQGKELTTLFTGLNNVRFKNQVKPGDVVTTECSIVKSKGPFYWAKGVGKVDGRLCVSAEFSFAILPKEEA